MSRGLTPRQARFVDEYLIDLNATQAAIRAGYSKKTAEWIGPQLLTKTHVAQAVAQRMKARHERTEITQDRVLQEVARLAMRADELAANLVQSVRAGGGGMGADGHLHLKIQKENNQNGV